MTETRTTSSTGGQKGVKLARFDLIPAGPLRELAEHYGRGARKYANHQWRLGYEWSKSIGALGRHFNDFIAGKDYDVCSNDPGGCSFVDADGEPFEPEQPDTCFNHTGSHHMAAVAWHAFLLLEFKDTHPDHDDRYTPSSVAVPEGWLDPELWENAGYVEDGEAFSRPPFAAEDMRAMQDKVNEDIRKLVDAMRMPKVFKVEVPEFERVHLPRFECRTYSGRRRDDGLVEAVNDAHNGPGSRG